MTSVRQLLRFVVGVGVPAGLVACTALTGASDLRAVQAVTRDSGGSGDDDDDDTADDDDDDGGTTEVDSGLIGHGPFCSTLNPTPIACYDFELPDLSSLTQEISGGGTLLLEPEGDGKVLTASVPNDSGWAYTWKDIGTPNIVEWSFDVDLSAVTTDFVDFNEIGMNYGTQSYGCGVEPSTQNGKVQITEFCGGEGPPGGKGPLEVPHILGDLQPGPGWHHIEVRVDIAAHTLSAKVRRPDGVEGSIPATTPLSPNFTPTTTFLNVGIPFANSTVTQKVRIDNVVLRTF